MGSLRLKIAMRSGSPCGPTPAAPSPIRAPPVPSPRRRAAGPSAGPSAERRNLTAAEAPLHQRSSRAQAIAEAVAWPTALRGLSDPRSDHLVDGAAGPNVSVATPSRRWRRGATFFGGVAAVGCDRPAERLEISKRGGPGTPRRGDRPETKAPRRGDRPETKAAPLRRSTGKRGYPAAARSSRAASTADWRRASSSWLMMARSAAGLTGLRMIARPVLRTCSRTCSP